MFKIPKLKKPNLKIKSKLNLKSFKRINSLLSLVLKKVRVFVGKVFTSRVTRILKRVTTVFVFVAVFIMIGFAVMIYGFKSQDVATVAVAKYIPYPIAIVDYDFVTYRDFISEKNYIHHFYSATEQDQGAVDYNVIDKQIIDQLVENKIIKHKLPSYNITVSNIDIDNAINVIIDQNGGKDKVEKVLNDLYGLTLKEFRKLVKVQLERDKVNDQVITRVTARHILIRADKDASADTVEAARVKADDILNQIKGGLDFAEAAKKYSEDTGSAENGGLLDPFARGDMVDAFSDTAFTTSVGEISAPVRTEFGWHIIKVESKTGTVDKKFVDWSSELKRNAIIYKFFDIKL